MPSGTLEVTPLTINGLAQNGFPTSQTFIGCYVSPSEKQRTNSAQGPDPQFHDTLRCNVGEADHEVTFDIINEDPSRPGPIGYAKVELQKLFSNPRFEDWVPLASMTGGPLGHLYIRMNFTGSSYEAPSGYGQAPPPPAYHSEQSGFPEEKRSMQQQDSFHASLGPQSPMPTQYGMGQPPQFPRQEPIRYNSQSSLPGSESYHPQGSEAPPPVYTPPPVQPVQTPQPVETPEPVQTAESAKTKKKVPDWMKYGGAALAGAAAAGLGTWAVHEALEDSDEEKEQHITTQHYQAPPPEGYHHQQRSFEDEEGYRSESYQQHYVPPEEEEREEEEREEEEEEEEREEEETTKIDDSMWQ